MKRIKKLAIGRPYKTSDGQEKKQWITIGHIMENEGRQSIKIDVLPVGEFNGWVNIFDMDEQQQQTPRSAPRMQVVNDDVPSENDDILF